MSSTPHKDKLIAALNNPKCSSADIELLKKALELYNEWSRRSKELDFTGRELVDKMVELLNWYKDEFEVGLLMGNGSSFIKRQKGQLKLDNSILEEFLVQLVDPRILHGLRNAELLEIGPNNAFMSLAFFPRQFDDLINTPSIVVKTKDQDFIIGRRIYYKFSTSRSFNNNTKSGDLILAVLAAECKANLVKTMFQEARATASVLKQGCPVAKYYVLVEYLDMPPEDCRLTAIDNVFLIRRAHRLPPDKRNVLSEVEKMHRDHPIDPNIIWKFVEEIQKFIDAVWYNPEEALERGSFI
jgi:hypothetical protein